MNISFSSRHKILHTLFYGEMKWSRIILASVSFIWAILVVVDPTFPTGASYFLLISTENKYICSWMAALSGLIHLHILTKPLKNTKTAFAFDGLNALMMCLITASAIISDFPPPPTLAAEIVFMFISVWVFIRSGSETNEDVVLGKRNEF